MFHTLLNGSDSKVLTKFERLILLVLHIEQFQLLLLLVFLISSKHQISLRKTLHATTKPLG